MALSLVIPRNFRFLVNSSGAFAGVSVRTLCRLIGVAVLLAGAISLPAHATTRIRVASGNNQSAYAGSALPAPLVARVTDQTGNPIAGAIVTFSDGGLGGTFSANPVVSD